MGCLGGCLSRIFWAIVAILVCVLAWLAWLLNWVCWAVFKILYILLFILCLFCSSPPSPATIDAAGVVDGNGNVNWTVLTEAAEAGDVGAQYLLAQKSQEYVERDDWETAIASTMSGIPEQLLREDAERKDKIGRQAEHWYGKVADKGYMLARYKKWGMVLSRWERKLDYWCWLLDNCWKTIDKEKQCHLLKH